MNQLMETGLKEQIIDKAKEFGACAAGISDVEPRSLGYTIHIH
jgi:hypothetical protein